MDSVKKEINHPCFNVDVCNKLARAHLPVAPDCNIQCNFCNRLYDCVNVTRPGVTSKILTPGEASEKFIEIKKRIDNISIVGFAGPGDPLANFDKVRETANLIRKTDNKVSFCLSTNGLLVTDYIDELIEIGFSYITITVNAIDKKVGAKIYEYITYEDEILTKEPAAEILIEKQQEGLRQLVSRGITCKINTIYLKGINDFQIEDIAKMAAQKGVYIMNIKGLIPVKGSKFEKMQAASSLEINSIRKICSKYIKQMYHCRQCRADSVGLLKNDQFKEFYC